MRIDASLPQVPLPEVPAVARAAEELGFDALWTSETRHDPFLACALIAEHTSRLQFGTAIAVSFARSPANLAYLAWDLAAQSGGRFILGLGTQVKAHIERRFGLHWPDSVTSKLREQVLAIRAFWDCWQNDSRLNFRGKYYKLTLMSPFFNPGPIEKPDIPIYIAGVNPRLAGLAGELCDGFVVHPFHSPLYLKEIVLPAVRAGVERSGRDVQNVSISVSSFVATTPQARDAVRSQLAFYASTPSYRPVMALHGWAHVADQLSLLAARGAWEQMPGLLTDEMLAEFCLLTDESRLARDLKARYSGIAHRLGLYEPLVPGEKNEFWRRLVSAMH